MTKLTFTPCSNNCPALTGKPYGRVKYCPMLENERHHSLRNENFPEGAFDLRFKDASGKNPYYSHPNYTDCCQNFQCCKDSGIQEILGSAVILQEQYPRQCEECGAQEECRPYGKNGRWICFSCGMKDETETSKNFLGMFGEN